jgi:tetratricopeptide (TPR) repeat protein
MHNSIKNEAHRAIKLSSLVVLSLFAASNVVSLAAPVRHPSKKMLSAHISRQVAQADQLLLNGKYAEAEELYHNALNSNSKDIQARVGYGFALSRGFKLDRAEEELNKALKQDPKNALAHAGKAAVMLNRLQSSNQTIRTSREAYLKQAGAECNQALDCDPSVAEIHATLGNIYLEEKRYDKAQTAFQGAIKLDPKYSDAHAGLGLAKLNLGDTAGAMTSFKEAITENTGNSTAHYGMGLAYLKQNQNDEAIKELNTSLYQNRNSAPVHLALGRAYDAQGNTVAGVKEYQESIRIKPENPSAYLGIANIRENRGDVEHAIAELRSGLELSPNSPELHLRVAQDSLKVEKLDDAIKEYEIVLNSTPRSSAAAEGVTRAYYLKAQKEAAGAFISSNEFEKAKAMINKAVAMNPNSMQLRLAQAKLRALAGEKVDLSSVSNPQTDPDRVSYAEALLAQNKFQEASVQMNTVIGNTTNAKDAFAVGDLALMIKDLNSADTAYQKAASFPGSQERAKRGRDMVAKARDDARQNDTLANDLAKRKQLASAVDKYHAAIFDDPRMADARIGLAETLEKLYPNSSKDLRDAAVQINAYMSLTPNLPVKEQEHFQKRVAHLQEKAYKIDQKAVAQNGGKKKVL